MVDSRYQHCFESASAAAGRTLSDDELDNLFTRAQGRMRRIMSDYGLGEKDAAIRAGKELAEEHRAAAAMQRKIAALNLQKRVATRMWISNAAENELKGKSGPGLFTAFKARMNGTDTPIAGGKFSTEAIGNARVKEYYNSVEQALKKAGLAGAARSGAIDGDIRREMYELSHKGDGGQFPGVSGNKAAQQIAQILHEHLSLVRQRLNDQGAWIGQLDDYVMRTEHDPIRIFKAGFDQWVAHIQPLLNAARTFQDVEPGGEMKFLRNVWEGLSTGVHMSDKGGVGMKAPAFSGPGNVAAKLSSERVLHFTGADAWGSYMDAFGTKGTMLEHALSTLRRGSQQEALLQHWGTNPRQEFLNTMRWLEEKYRGSHTEQVVKFGEQKGRLANLFGFLDGENKRPENAWGAGFGAGMRNLQVMAKLGAVLFTHLSSVGTVARELQRSGDTVLGSYGNALGSFLGPLQGKAAREMKDVLGAGLEGAHASLAAPGWVDDSLPGTMSKITNSFMRMTGLPQTVDWKKSMTVAGVSRILGRQLDSTFDRLMPETQAVFKQYGITPGEWDALRGVTDHFNNSSKQTLVLPDAALRAGLPAKAGQNLALKLATYFSDVGDRATITPGIADREFFLRGTKPGTYEGELLRFIAQFKTWPLAMSRQTFSAERNTVAVGGAIGGIMQVMGSMAVFGYLRATLNSWTRGQTAPSLASPANWVNAFVQGGGAGIYGDFLFGEHNSFGGGLADTILGPAIGQTENVMKLYNGMKDYAVTGDKKNLNQLGATAFKLGHDNTPFINLFYTRAALDYLLFNSLQETISPGHLRRMEKSLQQRTGQSHLSPQTPGIGWMNPSQHARTFGQ